MSPAPAAGAPLSPAAAVTLGDRHFCIRADGVLTVLSAAHPTCAARKHVTHSDGSHALLCGKGLRYVALLLVERMDGDGAALGTTCALYLETDSRVRAQRGPEKARAGCPTCAVAAAQGAERVA